MYAIRDYSKIHGEKCWETTQLLGRCENACPAGINIPGFVMAMAREKFGEALKIIRDAVPIGGSLGRICPHPCETECNRGVIDAPIDIMRLKRFAYDYGALYDEDPAGYEKPAGDKVAIIGGGPAGLTAGDFLTRLGYRATIFESGAVPGGMLAQAIPEFILPCSVINSEIDYLLRRGLNIKVGMTLGRNITIDEIWENGYKAILIATGASQSIMLNIPGSELESVVPALSFLKDARDNKIDRIRGKVVVIGGGNVAIDAARSARRLGASQVHMACLETYEQMPAFENEIDDCVHEGIYLHNAMAPQQFSPKKFSGSVGGVEFQRVGCLTNDPECGLSWDLVEGPEAQVLLDADLVIVAIGQRVDSDFLEDVDIAKDDRGRVMVGKESLMTSKPGIFMAGDAVTVRGTAVEAVASGKKAAAMIDSYLRGSREVNPVFIKETSDFFTLDKKMIPSFFIKKDRWETVKISRQNRIRSFEEVDLGFTEKEASEEAKRCLNCKQCGSCIFERGQICFEQASRILW